MKALTEKLKKHAEHIIYICGIFYCAGMYLLLLIYLNKYIVRLTDGDLSAELVNGWLLHQQGGVILSDWYFSTELRVLNIPLLYSILFNVTSSWHTVRMLCAAFCFALLALSTHYLCRSMGAKRYAWLCAGFLLTPFSFDHFKYVLWGMYYIPHIATAFFCLGMLLRLQREEKRKKRILYQLLLVLLAFVSCLGGMRLLIQFYLPLFLVFCFYYLSDEKKALRYIGTLWPSLCSALIGYGVNAFFLSKKYSFYAQDNYAFQKFDLQDVSGFIAGIFDSLGFIEGRFEKWSLIVNADSMLLSLLSVMALIYAIKNKKHDGERFLWGMFFLCALGITFILRVFTDMQLQTRYYLPVLAFIFPGIAVFFEKYPWRKIPKLLPLSALLLLMLGSGAYGFVIGRHMDLNEGMPQVADMLLAEGYENGYSTRDGPCLIEFSEGKLDVWEWNRFTIDELWDIDSYWEWLQKKSHSTQHPDGKVFIYLYQDEFESCPLSQYWRENIIFEDDVRVICGFESYDALKRLSAGGNEA